MTEEEIKIEMKAQWILDNWINPDPEVRELARLLVIDGIHRAKEIEKKAIEELK